MHRRSHEESSNVTGDLKYARGHGLGNDYLVVEARELPFEASRFARAICDRHTGVGSDGLLVGDVDGGKISLRIYNPDGSEAEKSGNGLRIYGAYLHGLGKVQDAPFRVHLIKDTVTLHVQKQLDGGALQIVAQMGTAQFLGQRQLAMRDGTTTEATAISLSNPHCVAFVDKLERTDFLERAPQICKHAEFPAGTNVQFARVIDRRTVEAWIWERGVGETQASGSSSCAVAAAAVERGYADAGDIVIRMPGGDAKIEVSKDYDIRLEAPAQIICTGSVREVVWRQWGVEGRA